MLTLGDGAGEPLDFAGVLLSGVLLSGVLLSGVLLSGVSAVCWAGYILLTKRVGARWPGVEGLFVSLVVAALVTLPFGVARRALAMVVAAGAGATLSSREPPLHEPQPA